MTTAASTAPATAEVLAEPGAPATPPRRGVLRRLLRQPLALLSLGYLLLLALSALLASYLAPYDPNASDVLVRLSGPSAEHPFGTDDLGRDVLSRALFAAQVALRASFQAVGLAAVVGIPIGLLIAFKGRWVEWGFMRLADLQQAIPMLLLAFAFSALLGRGLSSAMLAVSVGFAVQYMRITRAVVLAEREKPYIDAALVQGYPLGRTLFRHVLPNAVGPLIIQTSIILGVAIMVEATLSFLGLGVDTRTPSWGGMLEEARRFQVSQPMLSLVPGLAITLTVLSFNTLGDGLADAFGRGGHTRRRRRRLPRASAPTPGATAAPVPAAVTGTTPRATETTTPRAAVPMLEIAGLRVAVTGENGAESTIIKNLDLTIGAAETFGLVGESGSGKSMTASAVMGMVSGAAYVAGGRILLEGRDITALSNRQWRQVRGKEIGMVFQNPMSALSPVHRVGEQMIESLRVHEGLGKKAAYERAAELMGRVGIENAAARLQDYPHEFSGGMAQRAMIAAALACRPKLLIADEPTTALDATVQRQVLSLLRELRAEFGMTVLFISHDLAVVGEMCERIAVMREGEVVESGPSAELLTHPQQDYTRALIAARQQLAPDLEVAR